MRYLFAATVLLVMSVPSTLRAEEWKEYRFGNIRLKAPVELTEKNTENGKVMIGLTGSPLPNPKFTIFSLAIVPLKEPEKSKPEATVLANASKFSLDHKLNRELKILSSKESSWRGTKSMETLAISRFAGLPYLQYHIQRSFIKDGIRYSLDSSQLIDGSNQIAAMLYDVKLTEVEFATEVSRIRSDAERFFNSFECADLPELSVSQSELAGEKD